MLIYHQNIEGIKYLNDQFSLKDVNIISKFFFFRMTIEEYNSLIWEPTDIERDHLLPVWVYNADALFSEEDQIIRRRI
jgi:hypothetical protein